jgi:hypothetical protein
MLAVTHYQSTLRKSQKNADLTLWRKPETTHLAELHTDYCEDFHTVHSRIAIIYLIFQLKAHYIIKYINFIASGPSQEHYI